MAHWPALRAALPALTVLAALLLLGSSSGPAAVSLTGSGLGGWPGGPSGLVPVAELRASPASPIQHVIIIIQENHGTDNYFSQFPGAFGLPPGGIPQPGTHGNVNWYANQYTLGWNYANNQSSGTPAHSEPNIRGNIDNGTMDGYTYTDTNVSNGYYPSYLVPNELGLAQEYGFADNYFHAYAGPTLPNRFYYYADTSGTVLDNSGPQNGSNLVYFDSMPRDLERNGLSWTDYDGNYNTGNGTPCFLVSYFPNCPSWYFQTTLSQLMPMLYFNWIQQYAGQLGHEQPYSQLFSDLYTGNLPAVSWYTQDWLNGTEHPGTIAGFGGNVSQGQEGILGIVRAVENSPYWASTAIFLTYDEGGGFFDHVPPPQITGLGDGIRIPLVVISPYAKEGYVSHAYYTPSSLLHFIEWNWNLPPLGTLDAQANIPLDFFNFSASPRLALPQYVWGLPNQDTAFPWNYTQPVPAGLLGTYRPNLVTHGNVSWAFPTQNDLAAAPAQTSDGSILYVSGMDGFLRALDPVFGGQLWKVPLGEASWSVPALLPNDGVIATNLHGGITAFSSTGALRWNLSVGAPIYGGLTVAHGNYYGGTTNGSLFGVSANGTLLWFHHVSPDGIYAPPTFDPVSGFLLASASVGGVVAVDLSGSTQWTAAVPGGVFGAPAVSAGAAYVTSTAGGLYPIAITSGGVGTPATLPGPSVTSPVVIGSSVYAGNETGFLQSFSLPGLGLAWNATLYGDIAGTPVEWQNHLWVATGGGRLYELPLAGGAPLEVDQSNSSFYANPLATSTGLYAGAEDGELYAKNLAGWLHISVTPTSASLTVNGNPVSTSGGKANLVLPPGTVPVVASQVGYVTQSTSATVSKGHATWLNITLSPSSVSPGWAAGSVTNASSGAGISGATVLFVPGSVQGSTSGTGAFNISLNAGTYGVFVNETGYQPYSNIVTIAAGATSPLSIQLSPLPHVVNPGWVAGTVSNQTSGRTLPGVVVHFAPGGASSTTDALGNYNMSLSAGSYAVFVNVSGYQSYSTSVSVTSSVTTPLFVQLVPIPRSLPPGTVQGTVYNGTPSTPLSGIALLFMPGSAGTTSGAGGAYSLALPAGAYSIFVNATGYQAYVGTVTVTSGSTVNQDIALTAVPHTCPSCNNTPGTKSGTAAPINLLLYALLAAAIAAAVLFLMVVIWRGRKREHEHGGEMEAAAAGPAYLAGEEPPDPSAGSSAPAAYDESAPGPGEGTSAAAEPPSSDDAG